MRALDTITGCFVEIDPKDKRIKYAILSHTWDSKGEQTYRRLRVIQNRHAPSGAHENNSDDDMDMVVEDPMPVPDSSEPLSPIWADPKLSPKIREACRIAREEGYRYLWIDSCCINKTSSSELSESINSMYLWYSRADVCYAFLHDVSPSEDHKAKDSSFRRSRWFTRGWTLQELIAPMDVVFLAEDWTTIGSKESLADLVTEVTGIDSNALLQVEPLGEFSVAQRLSWAAKRETTRVEDRAYSLLGLFGINMPTLYGEGKGAFRRLQEEIMRRTPDQSLFAWTQCGMSNASSDLPSPQTAVGHMDGQRFAFHGSRSTSLLALSLNDFSQCAGIETLSHNEVIRRLQLPDGSLPVTDYCFTPNGIRVQLPMIPFSSSKYFPPGSMHTESTDVSLSQWFLVILGCEHRDFPGHLLGRICHTESSGSSVEVVYSGCLWIDRSSAFDLLYLSPATVARLRSTSQLHVSWNYSYISQPQKLKGTNDLARWKPHETIKLVLPKKDREALSAQGYTVTLHSPDDVYPHTSFVTLVHDAHAIVIEYWHTLGTNVEISASVKTSGPSASGIQGTPRRLGPLTGMAPPTLDECHATVTWIDSLPWTNYPRFKDVELAHTPVATAETLRLSLVFATRNHYRIGVELLTARVSPGPPSTSAVATLDQEPDSPTTKSVFTTTWIWAAGVEWGRHAAAQGLAIGLALFLATLLTARATFSKIIVIPTFGW